MIRYRVLAIALARGRAPGRMRNLEDEDGRPRPSEALHQQAGALDGYCGTSRFGKSQAQTGRRISLKVVVLLGTERVTNSSICCLRSHARRLAS